MPKKRKVKKAIGKAVKMNGRAAAIGFKRSGNASKRKTKSHKRK